MLDFPGKDRLCRSLSTTLVPWSKVVFVLSTGRTGTQSLARLMGASEDIDSYHEPWDQMLEETKAAYENHPLSDCASAELARHCARTRVRSLLACLARRRVYAETSNRLTYIAAPLARFFHKSYFIHLHRHPGDVVRSAMRRHFYDGHPWDRWRIVPRADDPFYDAWGGWGAFEKCCWYWRAVNEWSLGVCASLPQERVLDLPFDALVGGDPSAAGRMFGWLGVRPPPTALMMAMLRTKRNAQEEGEYAVYGAWTPSQRETLARIAEPVASQLGYVL
jgi:Sulfotransferase family